MLWFRQTLFITVHAIKLLPQRLGSASTTILSVAGVVATFVAILSIAEGFNRTMTNGITDDAVVMTRAGATSELNSILTREQVDILRNIPGLKRENGKPLISAERYVVVNLTKRDTEDQESIGFRGVNPDIINIRRGFELVEGRMFETGVKEVIIGSGLEPQFENVSVGDVLKLGSVEWAVVGKFSMSGGIAESEIWADTEMVPRGATYSNVYMKLEDSDGLADIKQRVAAEPRLTSVAVQSEEEYYSDQSQALSTWISLVGYSIAGLMGLGSIFGAVNAMSSAVSSRSREFITLRTIGFRPGPIITSVLAESSLLALLGAILGGAGAYLIFDGFEASTLNVSGSLSQVMFSFVVTPDLLIKATALAFVIGILSGILPALAIVRKSLTQVS